MPLDFNFWGKIKSEVYFVPVDTRGELENRVKNCFANLNPSKLQGVMTEDIMLHNKVFV